MSYDFRMFKRKAGEDPLVTAHADSDGLPTTPPDPQKEAFKRRVADALIARNPRLEIFQFDYDAVAKSQKITVEQARQQFRHFELNGPREGANGIQITLFDDEASVTVPFWHKGDKAADTFREIWSYLEIISREASYLVYDPQIDRVLDTSAGFDDSLACYRGVVGQMQQKLPSSRTAKKPWWRFW
jgi:hypothetical protein